MIWLALIVLAFALKVCHDQHAREERWRLERRSFQQSLEDDYQRAYARAWSPGRAGGWDG